MEPALITLRTGTQTGPREGMATLPRGIPVLIWPDRGRKVLYTVHAGLGEPDSGVDALALCVSRSAAGSELVELVERCCDAFLPRPEIDEHGDLVFYTDNDAK